MYRKINNLVIPKAAADDIAKLHRTTQVHNLYNVSGIFPDLKDSMGNMSYKEVVTGDDGVTVKSTVGSNTNLLLVCPSNELLKDDNLIEQIKQVQDGCHVIAVMQDVNLKSNPIPYDDSTLKFFGQLVERFVLISTTKVRFDQDRGVRFADGYEYDHVYTIYLLQKKTVDKHIDIDKGEYTTIRGVETEMVPQVMDGFPPLNSHLHDQHPVKGIRRMPILRRNSGTPSKSTDLVKRQNLELDTNFEIDTNRNDSSSGRTYQSENGGEATGFILDKKSEDVWKRQQGREFTESDERSWKSK